jgi:hypothetical protein
MTKINFVIGLTDVEDYDGFVYDTFPNEDNIDRVSYNIQRADTSIEKDSIVWELDLTLDATKNIIKVWEHIIRRPHLAMIHRVATKNVLAPTYTNYNLNIHFTNLIPILSDYKLTLTNSDYEKITQASNFGDMYLDQFVLYQASNINWQTTLEYACVHDTIDKLNVHNPLTVLPGFVFDFELKPNQFNTTARRDLRFVEWINENKDALAEKGYTLDDPYCTVGRLCIGKLIGDPWDEYQKLQKYSRICRTSMVTVEE